MRNEDKMLYQIYFLYKTIKRTVLHVFFILITIININMRQKVKIWHYYEKRVITVNMESSIVCAVPSETSMFAHQAVSSGINLDLLN